VSRAGSADGSSSVKQRSLGVGGPVAVGALL
jgi:hypothetical protein